MAHDFIVTRLSDRKFIVVNRFTYKVVTDDNGIMLAWSSAYQATRYADKLNRAHS
jgi:hypothetical protein